METSGNRTALGVTSDIAQQVGARLRKARESIGRSTSALSAKIKVREHYLVAIEDGNWNELPPGLNGRGLIRIYAKELLVSVPELEQAANQTVMPAEQDAQAPYQIGSARKESSEREISPVRVLSEHQHHVQGHAPIRSADSTMKTNTLSSASRSVKSSESTPSLRPSGYRVIETTPDEEPLDVVTPDVASILGISLDVMEESPIPQKIKPIEKPTLVQTGAPTRESQAVSFADVPTAPTEIPAVGHSENHTQSAAVPESAPIVVDSRTVVATGEFSTEPAMQTSPVVSPTELNQSEEVRPTSQSSTQHSHNNHSRKQKKHGRGRSERENVNKSISHEANASQQALQSLNASSASDSGLTSEAAAADSLPNNSANHRAVEADSRMAIENSSGVVAAEQYLKNHSPLKGNENRPEEENQTTVSRGLWIAVGLMAACVVVLVGGKWMMRDSGQTSNVEETKVAESKEDTAQRAEVTPDQAQANQPETVPSQLGPQPEQSTSTNEKSKEVSPPTDSANSAIPAASVTAAPVNAEPSTAAQVAPANTLKAGTVNAAVPKAPAGTETAEEVQESAAKPVSKTTMVGMTSAVLTLLEPIEIQVTADGQKIFSGRHDAGKVDIKFNKKAEIFVQDGSKAKLKYSGWEHGALGQAGRKRRIVLNAEAFAPDRP